jgi:hypothetical protein
VAHWLAHSLDQSSQALAMWLAQLAVVCLVVYLDEVKNGYLWN